MKLVLCLVALAAAATNAEIYLDERFDSRKCIV